MMWKKFTPEDKNTIVTLYRAGLKLDAIAETIGRERGPIRCVIKREGIPRRPRSWATYHISPWQRSLYGPPV